MPRSCVGVLLKCVVASTAGLSQEKAAERCGLHWTYLGQVERGRRNVTLLNILKIAAGLEIDAGSLVSGLKSPTD